MPLSGKAEAEDRRERRRTKGTRNSIVSENMVKLVLC